MGDDDEEAICGAMVRSLVNACPSPSIFDGSFLSPYENGRSIAESESGLKLPRTEEELFDGTGRGMKVETQGERQYSFHVSTLKKSSRIGLPVLRSTKHWPSSGRNAYDVRSVKLTCLRN